MKNGDSGASQVNLNNVAMGEQTLIELFEALRTADVLTDLSMANCMITDSVAAHLVSAIESNKALEKLNVESNSITPQTLVKLFEVSEKERMISNPLERGKEEPFRPSSYPQLALELLVHPFNAFP